VSSWLIILSLGLPLFAALWIWFLGKSPNQREAITLISAVALLLVVLAILPLVLAGLPVRLELLAPVPGLSLAFAVEPLGMIFACVASFLWIVNSVFSIGYMRGNQCFAIAIAATMGLAFAENLFTLFVCYEALTLSTYPLVTHHKNDEARRAGRTYLGILLGSSVVLLLPAIIATWVLTGSITFTPGGVMAGKVAPVIGGILLLLYLYGIGKAALMPLHRWLPAAMVAPTPVSALLHAVAVVKAGVFTVVKVVVYIFGLDYLRDLAMADVALYLAGFTILTASIIALRQDNLKRRLAYSTVSQLSYVILAALILSPLSTMGAALHIAVHAFGKITLFMAAGRRAQGQCQPVGRHRQAHALDHGGLRNWRDLYDWAAPRCRVPVEMVHAAGRAGGGAMVRGRGHRGLDIAERGLFPAHNLCRLP